MENLMEMEYVINDEKYLVTVTKVEEDPTEKDLNCEKCPCKDVCDAGKEFPTNEDFEIVKLEENNVPIVPISMIPENMTIEQWLTIIRNYGVILTD